MLPILSTVGMSFWQEKLSLKPWTDLLFDTPIFYRMFWNSVFYAFVIVILELCIAVPCAFGEIFKSLFAEKF